MPRRVPTHKPPGQSTREQAARVYEQAPSRRLAIRFYQSPEWRSLRAYHLARHPLCNRCPSHLPTPAKEVHHLVPRDVAPARALDPSNIEGLCRSCHRKTRGEDREQRRGSSDARPGRSA